MMMKPNDSMLFCRASFTSAAISVLACKMEPNHLAQALGALTEDHFHTG